MDQQIQNGQSPEFLRHLLKNPLTASASRQQLESLIQNHPQCSVFRMLLAKATQNTDAAAAAQNLHLAAVHAVNREVLFRLIHQPEQLVAPQTSRIYQKYQPPVKVDFIEPDAVFIEEKTADIDVIPFVEAEKQEVVDASFIEEKSADTNVVPTEETTQPEPVDAPFIEGKSADIDVVPSVETKQPEITDTSFTEEKPADIDAVPIVDIKQPEITDTSFIEEKPADIDVASSVKTEQPEITNTSFIEEKSADIDAVPTVDIEQPELTNTSFIEEKSTDIDVVPAVEIEQPEIIDTTSTEEKPSEEEIVAENNLRAEDVNLRFVNEPAEEIIFPETETIQQQQAAVNANATIIDDYFSVIDEEVYDEITAIEDIKFEVIKTASPPKTESVAEPVLEPEKTEQPAFNVQDKAEKEMLSRIASIDYFTFNNRFNQKKEEVDAPVIEPEPEVVAANIEDLSTEKEAETVSKYHDDKMPYTFMWWLDKTRKEYADTYQPYVKLPQTPQNEQKLSVGPELHQQYIESIFHAKQPIGLEENNFLPATEQLVKRKEDVLIERFIIEEPHIHPPSADRLDTENKAKKSSEDGDVLVTETLAKIYFDQMLYHKALDTYKKLVLKFPEKSRYFTSQIELIEKKIN